MTIFATEEDRNSNFFTADDCLSIGVYEGKESRAKVRILLINVRKNTNFFKLEIVFPLIMEQIQALHKNGLKVGEVLYELQFQFSSDWKFLALMIGIKAANSTFFCPWCMCAKEYRTKGMLIEWNNYPRDWHTYTHNKCYDCTTFCSKPSHDYDPATICLLQEPFTPGNCLLDPLHCLLRTSDLIESILYERANQWGLNAKLEEFCIQNKIPLRIKKIDAETHSVEWYSMNAEERLCLWGKINVEEIFGAYNHF